MIEKDEDIEYGKWRQKRLDELDEEIAKDSRTCTCHPDDNPPVPCAKQYALTECKKKAAQFAKHVSPQKYATKDPWPTVPWREDEVEVPTLWGAIVVLLVVLTGLMIGLLWEVL